MSKKKGLFHVRLDYEDLEVCNSRVNDEGLDDLIKTVRRKFG